MKRLGMCVAAIVAAVVLVGPWVARAGAAESTKKIEKSTLANAVSGDFFAGLQGDSAAMDRAVKRCDEVLAKEPRNAEALAWRGSCRMYLSGKRFLAGRVQEGCDAWEKGLREMDRALELQPDSPDVLIPRGMTLTTCAAYAPPAESRTMLEAGVADLERALEVLGDEFNDWPADTRGAILTALANGQERLGNADQARANRERIADELAGTPYGAAAQALLRQQAEQAEEQRALGGEQM